MKKKAGKLSKRDTNYLSMALEHVALGLKALHNLGLVPVFRSKIHLDGGGVPCDRRQVQTCAFTFYVQLDSTEDIVRVSEAFLEGLTLANEVYYRRFPDGPCCPRRARLRYEDTSRNRFEPGVFRGVEYMVARGVGACAEFAAMVAGRRRARGEEARVRLRVAEGGRSKTFHAVVELADGTVIDPTADLQAVAADQQDQAAALPLAKTCACAR